MEVHTLLIIGHIMGTILGVGGATFIEFHLTTALKDGQMTAEEKSFLALDYAVVRIGLIIGLFTGFGFLLIYKISGSTFRLMDPVLWAKMVILIIIAANAVLLQARKISLYWGAAFSFVSWWVVAVLGVFLTTGTKFSLFGSYTFGSVFMSVLTVYALSVVAGAYVLHKIRTRVTVPAMNVPTNNPPQQNV